MTNPKLHSGKPARKPATLGTKLSQGLASYVTAASAAGAGVLALTQPATAEVVYTPANVPILVGAGPVALDLNNDGIPDFQLSNYSYFSHGIGAADLKVAPAQTGNAVWTVTDHKRQVAAPAFWGVVAGSNRKFQAASAFLDFFGLNAETSSGNTSFGLWGKGVRFTGPFLGLKFMVGGEVHYGWARLTVVAKGISISATLTGYAYETIPNRPILTGFRHGTIDDAEIQMEPSELAAPQPASLGRLALGAIGRSQ